MQPLQRVVCSLSALLCVSCAPPGSGTLFDSGITGYSGDGKIQDASQRSGLLATRGYRIDMPSFDLGASYEGTFRLSNIPTIDGTRTYVYLFVPKSFAKTTEPNALSHIDYSMKTSDGAELIRVESHLGEMIWSSPPAPLSYDGDALYLLDRSFFEPEAGKSYELRLKYTPAPGAEHGQGFVYIWNAVGWS